MSIGLGVSEVGRESCYFLRFLGIPRSNDHLSL